MSPVGPIGIVRLFALLAMVALAGAGRGALAAPQAQGGNTVQIIDFDFNPKTVTVPVGTTVTWTNTGQAPHTATSTTGAFDTGRLNNGQSNSVTFSQAGTFQYVCSFHENMTGAVVVQAAQATAAPAAATAAPAPQAAATGTLRAGDQPLTNNSIRVAEVTAGQDGWIAVHTNTAENRPGPVIGFAPVKAGTSTDVTVALSPAPAAGDKLWPMLHIDAGTVGTYEFPGADGPVVVGGQVVMQQITIAAAPAQAAPAPAAAPEAAPEAAPAAPPASLPNTGGGDGTALPAAIALVVMLLGLGFGLRRRAQLR